MSTAAATRLLAWIAVLAIGVVVVVRILVGGAAPITDGLADGARGGCPPTPNCVSSLATDPDVGIDPLRCSAPDEIVLAAVDGALVAERIDSTHWVARSRVFGFPDDVHIDISGERVDVLSTSRVGSDDLGVNRARVEALRAALARDPRCGTG